MKRLLKFTFTNFIIVQLFISNTLSFASETMFNVTNEKIGKLAQLKTGDIPIIVFRILLIVSLLGIILLIKKKKRHKPKRQKPKQKKKRNVQNKNIKK